MTPWTDHVKRYAAEHNISYKQAMKEASASYKKNKPKQEVKEQEVKEYNFDENNIDDDIIDKYKNKYLDYKNKYNKCKKDTLKLQEDSPIYEEQNDLLPSYESEHKNPQKEQNKSPSYQEALKPEKPINDPLIKSGEHNVGRMSLRSVPQLNKIVRNDDGTSSKKMIKAAKEWLNYWAKISGVDESDEGIKEMKKIWKTYNKIMGPARSDTFEVYKDKMLKYWEEEYADIENGYLRLPFIDFLKQIIADHLQEIRDSEENQRRIEISNERARLRRVRAREIAAARRNA